MLIRFSSIFIAVLLQFFTETKSQIEQVNESSFINENGTIIIVLSLLFVMTCVILDRRGGYRYAAYFSTKLDAIKTCLSNWTGKTEMNEKLSTQEVMQTPRGNVEVLDLEKTYIDADIGTVVRDSIPSIQVVIKQTQMEVDVPKVDIREVFQKRESKSNKQKQKKPKSKIRSRLQSKIAEGDSEKETEEYMEENSLTEDRTQIGA